MLATVVGTELLKLHRSRVTWATLAAILLGPLAVGLFMWIVREPGRARQLGLLGAKAELSGVSATWPSLLAMAALVVGMGGLLLLAFIVAYLFAREYMEGTAKNMLALPVGRHWFALAKLIVAAAWWAVLSAAAVAETFLVGALLGLPGLTAPLAVRGVRDIAVVAVVAFLLAPLTAWIATASRGYLAPLGFALAMLALAQVFAKTGWAPWFPWSVVASFVGSVGMNTATVTTASLVVVLVTFAAGVAATVAQLRYADTVE